MKQQPKKKEIIFCLKSNYSDKIFQMWTGFFFFELHSPYCCWRSKKNAKECFGNKRLESKIFRLSLTLSPKFISFGYCKCFGRKVASYFVCVCVCVSVMLFFFSLLARISGSKDYMNKVAAYKKKNPKRNIILY